MNGLPKLKVQPDPTSPAVIQDFEQAKDFPYHEGLIISVEGQMVSSYEDLLRLIEDKQYQNQEYLNVVFLPLVLGG